MTTPEIISNEPVSSDTPVVTVKPTAAVAAKRPRGRPSPFKPEFVREVSVMYLTGFYGREDETFRKLSGRNPEFISTIERSKAIHEDINVRIVLSAEQAILKRGLEPVDATGQLTFEFRVALQSYVSKAADKVAVKKWASDEPLVNLIVPSAKVAVTKRVEGGTLSKFEWIYDAVRRVREERPYKPLEMPSLFVSSDRDEL